MLKILICFLVATHLAIAADRAVSVQDTNAELSNASMRELKNRPPTLTLIPQSPGARSGAVWVRKSDKGLLVLGHVGGAVPAFPASKAELMLRDHVEIWLSVTPHPELPAIGWGNQFEDVELPKGEDSCANRDQVETGKPNTEEAEQCRVWARKQKSYRTYFQRLFVRQWQLAPGLAVESYAAPAYQTITQRFAATDKDHYMNMPEKLKPEGTPQFAGATNSGGGYDFQALLPWSIFPPSGTLSIRDFAFMVEVFSPAPAGKRSGPYSTTSPGRGYGDTDGFNLLRLDYSRQYHVTPCGYELKGLDIHDELANAYFFPGVATVISDAFILENLKTGYAYQPSGLSPGIRPTHFFSKQLGPAEFLCGPVLRYKRGDEIKNAKIKDRNVILDGEGFDARRLTEDLLLIKEGPRAYWSRYGSGQCGACPRAGIEFYLLRSNGVFENVFSKEEIVDDGDDYDVQISSDWKRIVIYRLKVNYDTTKNSDTGTWNDEVYCLQSNRYEECSPPQHIPPPEPRTLKFEDR
jgi:hypothetical protein